MVNGPYMEPNSQILWNLLTLCHEQDVPLISAAFWYHTDTVYTSRYSRIPLFTPPPVVSHAVARNR